MDKVREKASVEDRGPEVHLNHRDSLIKSNFFKKSIMEIKHCQKSF